MVYSFTSQNLLFHSIWHLREQTCSFKYSQKYIEMEQELRHRKTVRGDVDEIVESKNGKVNTKGI